jgi:hypothetical protein
MLRSHTSTGARFSVALQPPAPPCSASRLAPTRPRRPRITAPTPLCPGAASRRALSATRAGFFQQIGTPCATCPTGCEQIGRPRPMPRLSRLREQIGTPTPPAGITPAPAGRLHASPPRQAVTCLKGLPDGSKDLELPERANQFHHPVRTAGAPPLRRALAHLTLAWRRVLPSGEGRLRTREERPLREYNWSEPLGPDHAGKSTEP